MKKLIFGALFGLAAISVHANDYTGELLLGKSELEVNDADDDDTSFGLRAVYNVSPYFGLEIKYQDYGEAEWTSSNGIGGATKEKTTYDSFDLGIKGVLPLQSGFSLNARAGVAFWNVEVDISSSSFPGVTLSGEDTGNDFYYGIGGQYEINRQFIVGIEYTLAEFDISLDRALDGVKADLEISTLALTGGMKF